jgi:L-fuculose-phosphate aldolase
VSGSEAIRSAITEVGRRLYSRGLICALEGNVSVRLGDRLLVTPAGVCKGFLADGDLVTTDLEGRALDGKGRASSEILMHVAVYRRRPDVLAIVHAHPPTATAFAAAGIPLDKPLLAESVVTLGPVPVIPYHAPATAELAETVAAAAATAQAVLLANHGALTVGEDLWRAWERMETLEHLARVALNTHLLGQVHPLPEAAVARLEETRQRAGYPPPPSRRD